jgi:hypothetical protein
LVHKTLQFLGSFDSPTSWGSRNHAIHIFLSKIARALGTPTHPAIYLLDSDCSTCFWFVWTS